MVRCGIDGCVVVGVVVDVVVVGGDGVVFVCVVVVECVVDAVGDCDVDVVEFGVCDVSVVVADYGGDVAVVAVVVDDASCVDVCVCRWCHRRRRRR